MVPKARYSGLLLFLYGRHASLDHIGTNTIEDRLAYYHFYIKGCHNAACFAEQHLRHCGDTDPISFLQLGTEIEKD